MWISKKKWEAICSIVNKLDKDVKSLKDCHNVGRIIGGCKYDVIAHNVQKVNTNLIKCVSFDELAKFVIDGTPIERDEKITVKYHKGN